MRKIKVPEFLVRRVALSKLAGDPRNARTHGEQNLAAIRSSLAAWGQVEPLIVNRRTGLLVAGHGRVEAMRALGLKDAAVFEVDPGCVDVTVRRFHELTGELPTRGGEPFPLAEVAA